MILVKNRSRASWYERFLLTHTQIFFVILTWLLAILSLRADGRSGFAMHGDVKYQNPASWTHFSCYNPYAPKGGHIRIAVIGRTFDTLNIFLFPGIPPMGMGSPDHLIFDTLMRRSPEEPYSLYGRLAEKVEICPRNSWILFTLRKEAHFHDADKTPVTAYDVAFTFDTLNKYGSPAHKSLGSRVESVEVLDQQRIKFTFNKKNGLYNRSLLFALALRPVLCANSLKGIAFNKTGMSQLVGSGPYRIVDVQPGKSITYGRVVDYWGKNLAVNRGLYNFDRVTYVYFSNSHCAFEAFKRGLIDYWEETDPIHWMEGYRFPDIDNGTILRDEAVQTIPMNLTGLAFNIRNSFFQDIRVRKALTLLFDFEWMNKKLFNGFYRRTESFFQGTIFQANEVPTSAEKRIFSQFSGFPAYAQGPLSFLKEENSENFRDKIYQAHQLLKKAGWVFQGQQWVHSQTGKPLVFEILSNGLVWTKILGIFVSGLKKAGIGASIKVLDNSSYIARLQQKKFDMFVGSFPYTLTPGSEQQLSWLSQSPVNYVGHQSEVIDQLLDSMIQTSDRQQLIPYVRVLDRFLRHSYYVIPFFYSPKFMRAYHKHLGHPPFQVDSVPPVTSWWSLSSLKN